MNSRAIIQQNKKNFKKLPKIDRILTALTFPNDYTLTANEEDYFLDMVQCFGILVQPISSASMNALLREQFPHLKPRQLHTLINDAKKVYAVDKVNARTELIIQKNRIMLHLEEATKQNDLKAIADFEKILLKINNTIHDEAMEEEPEEIQFAEIVFTNDPAALTGDFEEAEYEEEE